MHRADGPELGPSQADGFLLPEVFPTGWKFVFTYGREKLLMRGLRISRKNNSSVGRPGQEAFGPRGPGEDRKEWRAQDSG